MRWIFLSPHLDDAVLSCGGLLNQLARLGEKPSIWTVFAGDIPPGPLSTFAEGQHDKWGLGPEAPATRRDEDRRACRMLGAAPRHLPFPDCIYRRSSHDGRILYDSEEAIFAPVHPLESELEGEVRRTLATRLPPEARIVCPLGVGGHVDHRLTRAAAEGLRHDLWYYADYPYVRDDPRWAESRAGLGRETGWESRLCPLNAADLERWVSAISEYASQVPVFWSDHQALWEDLSSYQRQLGGVRLWRRKPDV